MHQLCQEIGHAVVLTAFLVPGAPARFRMRRGDGCHSMAGGQGNCASQKARQGHTIWVKKDVGVSENDKIPSHMKCLIGKTGKYADASKFGGTKCADKPLYHQSLELQPAIVHPYYCTLLRKRATAKPATVKRKKCYR